MAVRPMAGKKETKDYPPGPPQGEGVVCFAIPQRADPSISGSPVSRTLALPFAAKFRRGLDKWDGPPGSRLHATALLEAVAAQEWGQIAGA